MRGALRTTFLATAALGAAVFLYLSFTVAPQSVALGAAPPSTYVTGAYHIHSQRSDGTGTVDEIVAAARRAGLQFIVLTDHGDATRRPDPPAYLDAVLCIDAVEVGTEAGHLVALGLRSPSPYPLAGQPRDVIDDVHRLGGWAVIAHPDSPKADLRWRGQNAAFDGIEWLNVDSEWRDETPQRLAASAVRSIFRPAETIAELLARPVRTLQRWDAAARNRPTFGLAAVDAHARIGWNEDEEPRRRTVFARPTYEAMFRTVGQTVVLDAPLSGNAETDARRIIDALAGGHSFSIVRGYAGPAVVEFHAQRGSQSVQMGERLPVSDETTMFRARVPQAPGAQVTLFRDGRAIAAGHGSVIFEGSEPGVYRVEVAFPGRPAPWLVSNPIVLEAVRDRPADSTTEVPVARIQVPLAPGQWSVERDAASSGTATADGEALRFDFRLAAGPPSGQYAALVTGVAADAGVSRVVVTARSSAPMRVSLQARLPGGKDGQRWRRSIYLDSSPREIVMRLQDFEPVGAPTTLQPVAARLQGMLFVVDTLNTSPSSTGTIWFTSIALGVGPTTE